MENALKDIKNAEEKARKIIEDAEKSREGVMSKANHDSMRLLNEKKEEIEKNKDRAIEKKAAELDNKKREIIEKGRIEADKINSKAGNNLKKAQSFVLKKFEEELNS
ncbi:hypothetical protein COV19_03290 [Candidatus Woesearchaeota archaeon CG10_big_fil_rev_8_21_14_0_10_44_13]|nr:MAG: hypothetical protein COV19_03290 [Candidatus Woesearchaeota archaeon CG10_big_fil_rev_8_21_14_0_10_44_13]